MRLIKVDKHFDLEKLFYPSFALPLMDVSRDRAVKIYGYCSGLIIKKYESFLEIIHENRICLDYADEILGLWIKPEMYISHVRNRYRELVDRLIDIYGWLGIATSSMDDIELFTSIFLSRATDFHRNTVRWMKIFLTLPRDDSIHRYVELIGRSFQLKQLSVSLKEYYKVRDVLAMEKNIYRVRKILLSISYVGPKVSDAYILFIKKDKEFAPIDRNLREFLGRFYQTRELLHQDPKKNLCSKYICENCPAREKCTSYLYRDAFRSLSGWIQNVAYLQNKLYCLRRLCSSCLLKDMCLSINT